MTSGIGATGIILIVLVALLLFGPSKLPELGKAFGRTLREFKNATKGIIGDDDQERKDVTPHQETYRDAHRDVQRTEPQHQGETRHDAAQAFPANQANQAAQTSQPTQPTTDKRLPE